MNKCDILTTINICLQLFTEHLQWWIFKHRRLALRPFQIKFPQFQLQLMEHQQHESQKNKGENDKSKNDASKTENKVIRILLEEDVEDTKKEGTESYEGHEREYGERYGQQDRQEIYQQPYKNLQQNI